MAIAVSIVVIIIANVIAIHYDNYYHNTFCRLLSQLFLLFNVAFIHDAFL